MFSAFKLQGGGEKAFRQGHAQYDQGEYSEAESLFQQASDRQERTLGKDHKETLNSKYWLGQALNNQEKHSEAESLFQQAADGRERTLGKDHKETLDSKYWLGRTIYNQKKYSEAESLLQQAAGGLERTLGKDHEGTLSSKLWLGRALYNQKKYSEAESLFQQAADGQERTLGKDHKETLYSKYQLGRTLYEQEKYSEAESLLQQAADGRERTLGKDHKDTLDSKYGLGHTFYHQKKYSETESLFQQAADGRERTLGKDHEGTLSSKHWLGRALYNQKKYSEAKSLFQQAADGWERTLGKDHENTLSSKHQLGRTLYKQEKYSEAEMLLQQAADGRERTLGKDHKDTLTTVRLLHKLQLHSTSLLAACTTPQQTLAIRLDSFFPNNQDTLKPYTDSEITEIASLLNRSNPQWSKVPRTYIVLRIIGHLKLLDDLINVNFSDYWFPVTKQDLPGLLHPSVRAAFCNVQNLVLTKSLDLVKGEKGQHCYFKQGESVPFEAKAVLGQGGFGQVDRVMSTISFKEYARKRVLRSSAFRGRRKEDVKQFITEIEILKRLKHKHVVEYVGSYTDPKFLAVIMSPIAQMDLHGYLARTNSSNYNELRTFFGCLATALEFLHTQNVRHKDIKPQNILVDGGNVLYTDFGLSFDSTDANGSTTTGMVNGRTPRYCAPEVALEEPRNTMSDIWSLGVVFLEMVVVLKGKTTQDLDTFLEQHGSRQRFIRTNLAALPDLIVLLERIGELSDNLIFSWIQGMLSEGQHSRPTASLLVESITDSSREDRGTGFCGICCVSSEEFSDFSEE
jgi:TolA-binding protein